MGEDAWGKGKSCFIGRWPSREGGRVGPSTRGGIIRKKNYTRLKRNIAEETVITFSAVIFSYWGKRS